MKDQYRQVAPLIRHLLAFTGWRAGAVVTLMVIAALSEGLGLLLLVPLMAFVGLGAGPIVDSKIVTMLSDSAGQIGLTINLNTVVAVFVALVIVRQFVAYTSSRLVENTRIGYVAALRKELFAALGETSWRTIRGGKLVHFGQIILMDSWRVGDAAQSLFRIFSGVALILVNFVVAFILSPTLALIVLVSISLLTWLFSNRFGTVGAQGKRITEVHNELYRVVENFLDNLRVARIAGAQSGMQREFGASVDDLSAEYSGFIGEIATTRMALELASAIGIGAFLLIAVNIFGSTGPELLLLIFITARLIPHCSSVNQFAHHLLHNLPAYANAQQALDECRSQMDMGDSSIGIEMPKKSIELHNVIVTAPDDSDRALLDDVSFTFSIGQTLAIEGASGAGKSTLADVLSGLLPADGGCVLLDGERLRDEQMLAWRKYVGYVPQATTLLRDTLRHNLTWVLQSNPTSGDMERAIACAEINAFLTDMPNGLDTDIDRREGVLSGGERQRIALARELLKRPRLLILDEATNALDAAVESRVLGNIRKFYPKITLVVIAHRPGTIATANRVIRLEKGRLVSDRLTDNGDSVSNYVDARPERKNHA